jgi:hypothetical protein
VPSRRVESERSASPASTAARADKAKIPLRVGEVMFKFKPSLRWLKWAAKMEEDVDVSAGHDYVNRQDESANAALEYVSRVLDDVFKQRLIGDEHDARFIFEKLLSYQGLRLEGSYITDAVTGKLVALLGSIKIDGDNMIVVAKLIGSIEFAPINITLNGAKSKT